MIKLKSLISEADNSWLSKVHGAQLRTVVMLQKKKFTHSETLKDGTVVMTNKRGDEYEVDYRGFINGTHPDQFMRNEVLDEALNPAAGEWVLYKPMGSFKKKFVSLHTSHRSAQIAMKKAEDKMYKNDWYGGYGIMSKDKWDKEDSRFKVESADAGKV